MRIEDALEEALKQLNEDAQAITARKKILTAALNMLAMPTATIERGIAIATGKKRPIAQRRRSQLKPKRGKTKRMPGEAVKDVLAFVRRFPDGVRAIDIYKNLGTRDGAMISRLTKRGALKRVAKGTYVLGAKA